MAAASSAKLVRPGEPSPAWIRPRQPSVGVMDFFVDVEDEDESGSDIGLVLTERYKVESLLGFGATSRVYEGVDLKTKRPIAIKILLPKAGAQLGSFFGQEARIVARVQNPHLVQASDFGEDQGRSYIVLNLLPGQPLHHLTRGTLLPCTTVCFVALDVLNALAALHAEGIVHRDVKPDNIFVAEAVGDSLHAVLLDLGFAFAARRMTIAPDPIRAVFGTAGFIAPEIFGGHPPDPRSDLYSLGAVLYVTLTGQPVPDFRAHPQIVLPSPQVFRPEIPNALAQVVLRALSDIDARFQTAEEMALALANVLHEPEAPVLVALPGTTPAATATPSPPALPTTAEVAMVATECPPTPSLPTVPTPAAPEMRATSPDAGAMRQPAARIRSRGRQLLVHVGVALASVGATYAALVGDPEMSLREVSAALVGDPEMSLREVSANHARAAATPAAGVTTPAAAVPPVLPPVAEAVAVPTLAESLEGVRGSLRECAVRARAAFAVDLGRDADGGHFAKIEVVGDEATVACARRLLEPLRFARGAEEFRTEEYTP